MIQARWGKLRTEGLRSKPVIGRSGEAPEGDSVGVWGRGISRAVVDTQVVNPTQSYGEVGKLDHEAIDGFLSVQELLTD